MAMILISRSLDEGKENRRNSRQREGWDCDEGKGNIEGVKEREKEER